MINKLSNYFRQLLQLYWDKKIAQEEAGVKSRRTSKDNRTTNPTLFVEDKDAEVDEEDCMVVSDNGATEGLSYRGNRNLWLMVN